MLAAMGAAEAIVQGLGGGGKETLDNLPMEG